MPIGLLQGLRLGIREGLKIGLTDGVLVDAVATTGINVTWTIDATSGKGVPADSTEWSDMIVEYGLSLDVPEHLYLCQEAAGNLADTIQGGLSGNSPLTKFNSPLYEQAVADWSRKAVRIDDTTDAFYSLSYGDIDTTSYAVLAYVALTAEPALNRRAINLGSGGTNRMATDVTTAPNYRATIVGDSGYDGTSANPGTTVHPVVMLVNRASSEFTVFTDQDKVTTTWVAPTGTSAYFSFEGCETVQVLYAAVFEGTSAEISSATVRGMLEALGWSPAWS